MSEQYFRHRDGGLYRFVAVARSADTTAEVVVYEHLWPFERGLWVRDRIEFESRFQPIAAAQVEAVLKQDQPAAQLQVNAAKAARRAAKQG
jgi:hypothetical protein